MTRIARMKRESFQQIDETTLRNAIGNFFFCVIRAIRGSLLSLFVGSALIL